MKRLLLALALLAPALAGCIGQVGGDDPVTNTTAPSLTEINRSIQGLPEAEPTQRVHLSDGDSFQLTAGYVQHDPGTGDPIRGMAYNGQIPGPEIHVPRNATVTIEFTNQLDQPTTVHWHGIRLDNANDGVPNLTQAPVEPGESFTYEVHVPDAGLFWYHPHVRNDMQKELGLYGALVVEPPKEDTEAYPAEDVLMLDDIRLKDGDVPHMYEETPTYVDSGRWGNQPFVNGTGQAEVGVAPGERHRLHIVNPSNARTWRLDFQGFETVEKISTGASYLEQPREIDTLRLGPAERAIVDVKVDATNTGRIVDEPTTWTLATVTPDQAPNAGGVLTANQAPTGPHERARAEDRQSVLEAEPDHEINLAMKRTPKPGANVSETAQAFNKSSADPAAGVVNPFPTHRALDWLLVDTDRNESQPRYQFQVGDVVELTVSIKHGGHGGGGHGGGGHGGHTPVPHPIHLHGQRLLVDNYGGEEPPETAWKDTFLANDPERDYQTTTVKVELSNPGTWLIHCHISEHSEAGMTAVMDVLPADGGG